jgi:hypothetical protein
MCPECEAVLKRTQPVPSGKKIKCPKCEFIFLAKALPGDDEEEAEELVPKKKESVAATAEPPKKTEEAKKKPYDDDDDEDSGGSYTVKEEPKKENEEPAVKFEDLRKKFPKSKRGPAMALTVLPSNFMMFLAILGALGNIGWFMRWLWPFVFSYTPPTGNKATNYVIFMCLMVVGFCINCMVAYGASKMHTLESIGWAWAATILCLVFHGPLGWIAGGLSLATLKKPEVIEGFEETLERASELRNMHGTEIT